MVFLPSVFDVSVPSQLHLYYSPMISVLIAQLREKFVTESTTI
jgi:hypothetical protein